MRRPERQAGRARGADHRPRRRAGSGHHLDEHGRPRHRHRLGGGDGDARGSGRGGRRALRDRHEPPREPANRQSAARSRRAPGRSGLVTILHLPRGRPDRAIRRDGADPGESPADATGRPRSRIPSSRARSTAPSGSSRDRTSRFAARCGSIRRSSTISAASSTDWRHDLLRGESDPGICGEGRARSSTPRSWPPSAPRPSAAPSSA